MKKLFSVFLSVLLVLQLVVPVWAAEVVASGECGSGVSWVLADDGTLLIAGSGKMYDYASGSDAPWAGLNVTGVAVGEGVTYIGKNAFASCRGVAAIIFFGKAPSFSSGAFNGVTAAIVYIPGSSWTSSVMKNYGGNVEWIPGVAQVPTITKLIGSTSGLPRQTIVIKEVPYAVGYAVYRRPANVNGAEFELIGVQEAGEEEINQFIHRTGLPGVTYEYKVTSIGIMGTESAMSAAKSGKFPTHTEPVYVSSYARAMAAYSFSFGFYREGETPSAQLMYHITRHFSADKWYIDYEINDANYTHEVPRAAFEEVVFSYFPRTAESLAELRSLEFYSAVTECYYFPEETFEADFRGLFWLETKELGDELYQDETWRIQEYNEDGTPYVPAAGDDYVLVDGAPAKIIGDISAKVQCANGRPMFLSSELRDHTPHQHVLKAVEAKEPTCHKSGCIAHYACYCGRTFADAEGTRPVDAILPQLQHVEEIVPEIEPTCTTNGQTAWKRCALCGLQMFPPSRLNKLGHAAVASPDREPTCSTTGSRGGTECSRCGEVIQQPDTILPKLPHTFKDGTCTVCGAPERIPGDFTGDDLVTNEDVSYLLWHTLFPADYPLDNNADFTGDGTVTNEDVSYLLWHTLFPADYPL